MTALAATGDLAKTPPAAVLSFCEAQRFSGTLVYRSARGTATLPLLNGVPELAGERAAELERALDLFVALREGDYELAQVLPPLEGADRRSNLTLWGVLGPLQVRDLLRYCEEVGLTGALTLRHDKYACRVRYTRGELANMTLEGVDDGDVYAVFGWTTGAFTIQARPLFGAERVSSEEQPLLKTLEVALVDIFEKSGRKKSGSDVWEERPSGAGYPRRRKVSLAGDMTLPFGLQAINLGDAPLPKAQRSMPPPPMQPAPDSTVRVFVVAPGTLTTTDPASDQGDPGAQAPSTPPLWPAPPYAPTDPSPRELATAPRAAPRSARSYAVFAALALCSMALAAALAVLLNGR